jgi:CheY-like chemotaxis protein
MHQCFEERPHAPKKYKRAHAHQALEIAAETSDIDAAFLDVVLPGGVTGVDLAKALRKDRRRILENVHALIDSKDKPKNKKPR